MTSRCRLPLYAVLDVDRDADVEAIQDAYRATVKEYHPDVFDHDDAQDLFVWATRAKAVLTESSERKRYDRRGHARFCEQEGWGSSACSAPRAAAVYWSTDADGRSSSGDESSGRAATVGTRASTAGATGTESTAGSSSTASTRGTATPSGSGSAADRVADATQRGQSNEASGSTAWPDDGFASQEGFGSHCHPEERYFRNIGQVDTDWDSVGSGWGALWIPVVGVGFSLVVLFGSFALILYVL